MASDNNKVVEALPRALSRLRSETPLSDPTPPAAPPGPPPRNETSLRPAGAAGRLLLVLAATGAEGQFCKCLLAACWHATEQYRGPPHGQLINRSKPASPADRRQRTHRFARNRASTFAARCASILAARTLAASSRAAARLRSRRARAAAASCACPRASSALAANAAARA